MQGGGEFYLSLDSPPHFHGIRSPETGEGSDTVMSVVSAVAGAGGDLPAGQERPAAAADLPPPDRAAGCAHSGLLPGLGDVDERQEAGGVRA